MCISYLLLPNKGLPWWLSSQESACNARDAGLNPWVGKITRRRKWQPTPVFLPGNSMDRRAGWGTATIPWGRTEHQEHCLTNGHRPHNFRQDTFISSHFCGSRFQAWLSWIFCTGSQQAEIKVWVGLYSHLEPRLGRIHFQVHPHCWHYLLVVVGLSAPTSCWMSARRHS